MGKEEAQRGKKDDQKMYESHPKTGAAFQQHKVLKQTKYHRLTTMYLKMLLYPVCVNCEETHCT